MVTISSEYTIYLYREKVDLRKGINGLSGIVRNEMKLNPYTSKSIYVFSGRNPRLKKVEERLRIEGESKKDLKQFYENQMVWSRTT